MQRLRVSIAGLMGVTLVSALGLSALFTKSETLASTAILFTWGMLTLAILGAICRRGADRACWLGFALFGCAYLRQALWLGDMASLSTSVVLDLVRPNHVRPLSGGLFGPSADDDYPAYFWKVGHCFCGLLIAALGAMLARIFFAHISVPSENQGVESRTTAGKTPKWVRWLRFVVLLSLLPILYGVLIASSSDPRFWPSGPLFLTCGLLGVAVLGALCRQGRRRAPWLGAALFGIGTMILTFNVDPYDPGPSHLAIDRFLQGVRPWLPPSLRGYPADSSDTVMSNTHILMLLDQPIPMRFPDETPLEDVLKHIESVTKSSGRPGIPIYVDPVGLQEAETNLQAKVRVDLDHVPLGTGLKFVLDQLGLAYEVQDGFLKISCTVGEWH